MSTTKNVRVDALGGHPRTEPSLEPGIVDRTARVSPRSTPAGGRRARRRRRRPRSAPMVSTGTPAMHRPGDAARVPYPRGMPGVLLDGEPVPRWRSTGAGAAGEAFAAAVAAGEDAVVGVVTDSGLRGRGGGGFPTGRKWTGIRDAGPGRRFAVCNAAEGEPGTFKDRALLRHDPYRVLEGLAIASFAIGAEAAYIATKARYEREAERLATAIAEITRRGPVRRPDHRPRARARRVPVRRGEGAARGDRGPRPAPPPAAALRARAVRHRRADRVAVGRRARPSGPRGSPTRRS